jgi:hypothetical protein
MLLKLVVALVGFSFAIGASGAEVFLSCTTTKGDLASFTARVDVERKSVYMNDSSFSDVEVTPSEISAQSETRKGVTVLGINRQTLSFFYGYVPSGSGRNKESEGVCEKATTQL